MKRQVGKFCLEVFLLPSPGARAATLCNGKLPLAFWQRTSVILDQVTRVASFSQRYLPSAPPPWEVQYLSCSSTSHGSGEPSIHYALGTVLAASPWMRSLSCAREEQEAGCMPATEHVSFLLSSSF